MIRHALACQPGHAARVGTAGVPIHSWRFPLRNGESDIKLHVFKAHCLKKPSGELFHPESPPKPHKAIT